MPDVATDADLSADAKDATSSTLPSGHFIALSAQTFPLWELIGMTVVDADGAMLLDAAAVVPTAKDRALLFHYFVPKGRLLTEAQDQATVEGVAEVLVSEADAPFTSMAMQLPIGTRIGVRLPGLSKRTSYASRLIGIAPNDALFVTPPAIGHQKLSVMPGESVEIVAVSARTVFVFNSTVEAVCLRPFPYCILSKPGVVRRVRHRRTARARTKLAVLYKRIEPDEDVLDAAFDGLGVAFDLSIMGMSLSAPTRLGDLGERVSLVFHVVSDGQASRIDAQCIIRSVRDDVADKNAPVETKGGALPSSEATQGTVEPPDALLRHGLEFASLGAGDKLALRSFILEQMFAL